MTSTSADGFRRRLRDRARLAGSFIKTPSGHATEILGDLGFDFVLIDEEHGPFDRAAIDLLMLAARAGGIAGLVRVSSPASILAALDMGAAGVVVPHVNSSEQAKAAVAAARYAGGSRGFSPSPRAGRYGALGLADHVARADATASVTIMIEHPDALRNLETIVAVQGVDALFLGLGDLAVAMGESSAEAPALRRAAAEICRTAQRHGRALMATAPNVEAGAWLLDLGVSALVIGSDQGFLRKAATQQLHAFQSLPRQEVAP